MGDNVFTLHKIAGGHNVKFPFSINEYQRYVFGDDKLAYRFGTDLAKAFVAHGPGSQNTTTVTTQSPINHLAIAVLSGYVPTATHSLRNHFTAYLNRRLIASNALPACKIDITGTRDGSTVRAGPQANMTHAYHIDRAHLQGRTIVVLSDIHTGGSQEGDIVKSVQDLGVENPVVFVYLASLDACSITAALLPILSSVVGPSVQDVDSIAHSPRFTMNDVFARYLLARDYTEFCRFLRGQDDSFTRLLLDYVIGGGYYEDELYTQNFKFLLWELDWRESI